MHTDIPESDSDSDTSNSGESRTFHPFPRLPSELRLKIWALVSPDPCVVLTSWEDAGICYRHEAEVVSVTFLAVIHSCREARNEFLAAPTISGSTPREQKPRYRCPDLDALWPKEVFFSTIIDTLDISPGRNLLSLGAGGTLQHELFADVKYLSTSLPEFLKSDDEDEDIYDPDMVEVIRQLFPSLEIITFRLDEPHLTGMATGSSTFEQWLASIRNRQLAATERQICYIKEYFASVAILYPEWKVPALRFREDSKFLMDPLGLLDGLHFISECPLVPVSVLS